MTNPDVYLMRMRDQFLQLIEDLCDVGLVDDPREAKVKLQGFIAVASEGIEFVDAYADEHAAHPREALPAVEVIAR